ncbi:MAG: hypothetical protein N3B18_02040, partial [Desulfobacterota bacterium]|nr:hypothetical protein [Thermodesulfobacteriota bacterium]
NGKQLVYGLDTGYRIEVTRADGTWFVPHASDPDGLNQYHYYSINIPMYDPESQPGGAVAGESAKVRLTFFDYELEIIQPAGGLFQVGNSGSVTTMHVVAKFSSGAVTPPPIPEYPTRIGGEITLNGIKLTYGMDSGISVYLTRPDGTGFYPYPYAYGLNQANCYVMDIIMSDSPDSAQPGEEAKLHVNWQGRSLEVYEPPGGIIRLGQKGSMTRVDIAAHLEAGEAPGFPIRIGGEVWVNGRKLLKGQDEGYSFHVTRQDGTDFNPPAYDNDGLNSAHCYIIDIPVYDETLCPGGAVPGEKAMVRVYRYGIPLTITQPGNGVITLGQPGSVTRVNIYVSGGDFPATTVPSSPPSGGGPGGGGGNSPTTTTPVTTTTASTTTSSVPDGGGGGSTTSTAVQPPPETTTSSTTTTTIRLCPAEQALGFDRQAELDALRAFRDKRLCKTKEGLELIALYYAYSSELTQILDHYPDIKEKVRLLICEVAPLLHTDAGAVLDSNRYRRVEEIASDIRHAASPALARALEIVLQRIKEGMFVRR